MPRLIDVLLSDEREVTARIAGLKVAADKLMNDVCILRDSKIQIGKQRDRVQEKLDMLEYDVEEAENKIRKADQLVGR